VSKFELDDGFAIRPDAFTNWQDEKPVDNSLIDRLMVGATIGHAAARMEQTRSSIL
jgi:hypothetical protein